MSGRSYDQIPEVQTPAWIPEPFLVVKRLLAVEARQRAQGVHDPDCARTLAVIEWHRAVMAAERPARDADHARAEATPCDCWLSREAT